MPAHHQKPAAQSPVSPRSTAKYTNKDGSKFITVPKVAAPESSQPSTPTAANPSDALSEPSASAGPAPAVNRKKQKRRQKAAAKAAAEQALNGHTPPASGAASSQQPTPTEPEDVASDDEDNYEWVPEARLANGHPAPDSKSKKSKKKKKKKNAKDFDDTELPIPPQSHPRPPHSHSRTPSQTHPRPHSPMTLARGSGMSRDKIWSTSNQEERERIKEFWLGLGEDERKSLVKVEKDAVLKKMKEQQKHTCSCTVCGRKRTAIEEELEGLYDAYYLELEQFANQGEGPPMLAPPPPRDFGAHPFRGVHSPYPPQPPSRGRIVEHVGDEDDEDDLEEVYSDEDVDEEPYSDDEPPEEEYQSPDDRDVTDFLTFGNSLQVKGGILTVADDLLKNDGKRFIEMMEQLAERRMAREEDARDHFSRGYGHPNGSYSAPHNHPPPEDDDYEEEDEEEDDYEDSQDEEYEEEEDAMTEEQRMEEGRRMFQIFAARMFEQRVLSAYKEKVAKERQAKLIEELEEENRKEDEQKARKAKNAQKKKEKAAEKRKALAEEKARKEAEKAAEESARLEAEQRRAAEQRQKAEEKRKQKEAQKKADEEARLKKEADRQRRIHEQREKQAEQERKAREAKEREKKLKDEQRAKEKEAREQKEREALERKEKQERDKREKEIRAAKAQKEAQEAREARERAKEEQAAQKASAQAQQPAQQQPPSPSSKRTQQPAASFSTALPQHPPNPAGYASPKVPVATPAIAKGPSQARPRTLSQQHDSGLQSATTSQPSSLPSHEASPHPDSSAQTSPRPIGQHRKASGSTVGSLPHPTQTSSPASGISSHPSQSTPVHLPPMGMHPPPGLAHHPPPPGFPSRMGHEPIMPPGFRPGPNMMMPPPGINGPIGRGFSPVPMPPPGFQGHGEQFPIGQGFPMSKEAPPLAAHNRQGSASFDGPAASSPAMPIGRPTPIGRPGSTNPGQSRDDQDDETQHLGSRALLEDDEPLGADVNPGSFRTQPPGPRPGFAPSPFVDTGFNLAHNPWGPPAAAGAHAFGPPGLSNPTWGSSPVAAPGFSMGSPGPAFAPIRPNQSNVFAIRSMICQTCRDLAASGHADGDGFIDVGMLKKQFESQHGQIHNITDLFDTEGNASNGGGTFENKTLRGVEYVRWLPHGEDSIHSQPRSIGAPGQIGSPLAGSATLRGV